MYCSINPLITPANHTSLDVRSDVCLEENRVKSHEKQGPTGMYDIVVLFRYYSCSASSLRNIEDVLRCVVVFVFLSGFSTHDIHEYPKVSTRRLGLEVDL